MAEQHDTDGVPLDGDSPLTSEELVEFRRWMREMQHARWAWRKARVYVPILGGAIVSAWQGWDWITKHIKVTP